MDVGGILNWERLRREMNMFLYVCWNYYIILILLLYDNLIIIQKNNDINDRMQLYNFIVNNFSIIYYLRIFL